MVHAASGLHKEQCVLSSDTGSFSSGYKEL